MRHLLIISLLVVAGCSRSSEEQLARHATQLLKEGQAPEALALVQEHLTTHPTGELRQLEFLLQLRLDQLEEATATWQALPKPASALSQALRHRDVGIRTMAARLAVDHPRMVSLGSLCRAANDPAFEVRGLAVRALGKRGETAAFKQLFRALHDSDWRVRAEAADAFARLDDPVAAKWLITALEDPDGFVRYRAASALCEVTTPASIGSLQHLLPRLTVRQQTYLAVAMAQQRDPEAEELLLQAVGSAEEELRQAAATALRMYASPAARAALNQLSEDASPKVRQRAAASLKAQPHDETPLK